MLFHFAMFYYLLPLRDAIFRHITFRAIRYAPARYVAMLLTLICYATLMPYRCCHYVIFAAMLMRYALIYALTLIAAVRKMPPCYATRSTLLR